MISTPKVISDVDNVLCALSRLSIVYKCNSSHICYAQTIDRDNPWIALLKVWIRALRGQSMDCASAAQSMDCAITHQAFMQKKKKGIKVIVEKRESKLCLTFRLAILTSSSG